MSSRYFSMNKKLFLISLVFLFNSFSFAGEIHNVVIDLMTHAVRNGDMESIKIIAESEEYKNNKDKLAELIRSKDRYGKTSLHYIAFTTEGLNIAEFLLENGADINIQGIRGYTPLNQAAFFGDIDLAKFFLEQGADSNTRNRFGNTPLHFAVRGKHLKIVKILLEKDTDVNAQNNEGFTPLDLAYESGYLVLVNALEQAGAVRNRTQ